ncbi:hypothetical protein BJ944DRAFT_252118 [Cunninghamella echinulata]|nr:hypothetical protein BJ944DRAFT_252118 [Cunninghamella echinulata]
MREPNLCFPSHNKAAVCITSALYDRRALDCTASLPLINSLTHLAYLTSTSPRIREILVLDGGLERLVRILSPQHLEPDKRSLWKWSLAFQCVVNVGVRGTEQIRTKVVEAGMIPIVLRVLENFLRALELVKQETERTELIVSRRLASSSTELNDNQPLLSISHQQQHQQNDQESTLDTHQMVNSLESFPNFTPTDIVTSSTTPTTDHDNNNNNTSIPKNDDNNNKNINKNDINKNEELNTTIPTSPRQQQQQQQQHQPRILRKSTFPYVKLTASQRRKNRMNRESMKTVLTWQDPREPNIDNVFYREEDILLSLQLLAYLSKYPHIRNQFHTNYDRNVFSVVERFCHRLHPNLIQYWAGVIMRNACRKDETKGGTRRCANMHCGKWESQPREFAKCRRCRKAKYCCKACQSKAWADGHRWWCIERHASVPPQDNNSNSNTLQNGQHQQQQDMNNNNNNNNNTTTPANTTLHNLLNNNNNTNNPNFLFRPQPQQHHHHHLHTMTLMTGHTPVTNNNNNNNNNNNSNHSTTSNNTTTDTTVTSTTAAITSATARLDHAFHRLHRSINTNNNNNNNNNNNEELRSSQQGRQQPPTSNQQSPNSTIVVHQNLPLSNTTVIDQDNQNGSTESSGSPILMDMGVHMEL